MRVFRILKDERGIAEFLSATWAMFFLFIIGAFLLTITQAWNAKVAVQQAAFEAARIGVASDDPVNAAVAAASNFASGALPGWNDPNVLDVRAELSGSAPETKLTVAVHYKLPVKLYSVVNTPAQWDLAGTATMYLEETP